MNRPGATSRVGGDATNPLLHAAPPDYRIGGIGGIEPAVHAGFRLSLLLSHPIGQSYPIGYPIGQNQLVYAASRRSYPFYPTYPFFRNLWDRRRPDRHHPRLYPRGHTAPTRPQTMNACSPSG